VVVSRRVKKPGIDCMSFFSKRKDFVFLFIECLEGYSNLCMTSSDALMSVKNKRVASTISTHILPFSQTLDVWNIKRNTQF